MTTTAPTASTWWVEMFLGEVDGVSTARARLHTRDRAGLSGSGTARVSPREADVPEIGFELAAARALSDLAHQLLIAAADDISGVTRERVVAADLGDRRPARDSGRNPRSNHPTEQQYGGWPS